MLKQFNFVLQYWQTVNAYYLGRKLLNRSHPLKSKLRCHGLCEYEVESNFKAILAVPQETYFYIFVNTSTL